MRICVLWYIILFAFGNCALHCQNSERPTVALVLSGGSAKGMAHIGVLKVLEKAGIKPDIITGTSMGSIVGGLYSIGYSAKELDSIASNSNWDLLLSNNISLRDIVMEEKRDFNNFLLEFPIHEKRIYLPSGLIEGQKLSQLFSELCWRAVGIEHFDHFPIRFRCLATDIISGESVAFEKGDLAAALRASMSIPTLFTPVYADTNRLLVDGGVLRNFPVKEAKEMGADIIIGVYVGFKDSVKPEDIISVTDVLTRTSTFAGLVEIPDEIKLLDVFIEPDMKDIQSVNFDASKKIIERGEIAAMEKYEELLSLAKYIDSFPKPPLKLLPDPELIYIHRIEVKNNINLTRDFIVAKAGIKEETWISKKDIERALDKVYGTRFIDKITYEFKQDPNGYILTYIVKESPNGFLKTSINYDNIFGAGMNVNYTHRNIFTSNSKFSSSLYISKVPRWHTYFNQYLGEKQMFILTTGALFENNNVPIYRKGNKIGLFGHQYYEYYLSTKYTFSPNHLIEVQGAYEYAEIRPKAAIRAVFPEFNFNMYGYGNFSIKAGYEINFRNNRYFPTWGNRFKISYKKAFKPIIKLQQEESVVVDPGLFNTNLEAYYIFNAQFSNVKRITKKLIMDECLMVGLTSDQTVVSELFFTGGFNESYRSNIIPFAGMNMMEYSFQKFLLAKLGITYNISKNLYLAFVGNALKNENYPESLIFDLFRNEPEQSFLGYAFGIKYKSFLGPCSFFIGDNNKDAFTKYYLNIGYEF